jgi:hypothetical protein
MQRVILIVVLAACGSKTSASRVLDGDESNLADCQFVQKVKGSATGTDADVATRAKDDARRKAAAAGATHIRWLVPCCTEVEGDAFRCDLPK